MDFLESVFNHLALPPKLPGKMDGNIEEIERSILNRLIDACNTLKDLTGHQYAETWAPVLRSLLSCQKLNSGRLEKTSMLESFKYLQPEDLLVLHVVAQNAALLIRSQVKNSKEAIIFEVFEASPCAEDVLAAGNVLQWDFPGRAVEISIDEFRKEPFQESLASFLEQASMESLKRFEAHAAKANASIIEARDTTDPALITQMLMPLLEALGSPTDVPRLRKRVRDEVNIQDAEFPWRRLPFWLVLRVTIQRQLCLALGSEAGRACYKFLICVVLAHLLRDCAGNFAPELTMMLKAKLCRRLAKLEIEKSRPSSTCNAYEQLFNSTSVFFEGIVTRVTAQVELAWTNFKSKIKRPISQLPTRADERSLLLSLPNSERYLQNLIGLPRFEQKRHSSLSLPPTSDGTMQQVTLFTDQFFKLAGREKYITKQRTLPPSETTQCEARCRELASSITTLFTEVGDAYIGNPEEMSTFVLSLFILWIQMDNCALKACPLLREYAPIFRPELLDVLQLPGLASMQLLRDVQTYLRIRCEGCRFSQKTIFTEPQEASFAARYLQQSHSLSSLQQRIETASSQARERKKSEWIKACHKYDSHTEEIASGTCVCTSSPDGTRNVKGCAKCWNWRCRKRMKISIHEDFLPVNEAQKAAVLFELGMPTYLASYRDATFKILSLGHPDRTQVSMPPVMLLTDYSQLSRYMGVQKHDLSLASATKSFLQTHYKSVKMKADLSDILHPLGLDFAYYDTKSGVWLKDLSRPLTFQHLCGIQIPGSLQAVIPSPLHPPPVTEGPSSYEIIANQTKCPPEISIHEFMSYQRLLSGKTCRWITILVELGASNLNFSAEDTMQIISQLAVQAGPAQSSAQVDCGVLRSAHIVFQDPSFCQRLVEQIGNRLRNIITNWREVYCMEMLITLSLRLFSLTTGRDRQSAEILLKQARQATLQWVSRLRDEVRNTAAGTETAATYGFWAALLCRRTFTTFIESRSKMGAEDLCSFVQASIALQENLVVDLGKLPLGLKNMLARDMKMARRIRSIIILSIQNNPDSLGAAINKTWSDSSNATKRIYSQWNLLSSPHERWAVSTIKVRTRNYSTTQVVYYNFIEGHLLVDGKPLGRLPLEIRQSEEVRELFGNQHLLTYPSPLFGMSHVMAKRVWGQEVHFGLREKKVVIRALTRDSILEYVPRHVFMDSETSDLPLGLIDNCVHWLNLQTHRLEIRRKPTVWKMKIKDWVLDVDNRRAQRGNVFLVDPHSELFKSVAEIFRFFDDPRKLTVYQPNSGPLSLELRHLALSFFVNNKKLLQCRELKAEIDPDQDPGTLYGFQSKIVLRDVDNIQRRSIITALGELSWRRYGMHVIVLASSCNEYGRFGIDTVLGRLSSPPEPRLLYSKAQFHAFTSFVLPDPLTSRTGVEEALYTLRSAYSQPWTPLKDTPASILKVIQGLSPSREYYPKDKRRLQTVAWDQRLTVSIQHESYAPIVSKILVKSDRLRAFNTPTEAPLELTIEQSSHLQQRGEARRLLYERVYPDSSDSSQVEDFVYNPRDRQTSLSQSTNVYQIVKIIQRQPFCMQSKRKLSAILHQWNLIGGFPRVNKLETSSGSLSDSIENNLGEQWGSLVNFCRQTEPHGLHRLMFRLGLLSFATKPEIDAIYYLAAYGSLSDLKTLRPPSGSSFADFRLSELPKLETLLKIVAIDFPGPESTKRKNKKSQILHVENTRTFYEAEGKRLIRFILKQWPCSEPCVKEFESTIIDVDLAVKRITPEWDRLWQNHGLSQYVAQVQNILDRHRGQKDTSSPKMWSQTPVAFSSPYRNSIVPSLSKELIPNCGMIIDMTWSPNLEIQQNSSPALSTPSGQKTSLERISQPREITALEKILDSFLNSPDALRQQYGTDLKKSLVAFGNAAARPELQKTPPSLKLIRDEIGNTLKALKTNFGRIKDALSTGDTRFKWLQLGSLWPVMTPVTILEQLRSSQKHQFGSNLKESLISYGSLVTTLQRLHRIAHAHLKREDAKLGEEWGNSGHQNWSPNQYPDWLLFEIESDLLIREEQIIVAHSIISPASRSNSVLQMNMGKGKTSCIVPMAMAILADQKQLARLIVPKALLSQTAQTIQSRLGGLVGREIRHVPFSRTTSTTPEMLQLYFEHHLELRDSRGVMLGIPEHLLSYKLSGLQRLVDSRLQEAQEMIEFQSWLNKTCRDVLDESDFTLAVKTQLIYPSGPQKTVDGHPHRWEVVQVLLSLVEDHLVELWRQFPKSIEVVKRAGGFPMVHFLHADVEDALHQRIINDICNGRISFLRLLDSNSLTARSVLKRVLSEERLNQKSLKQVCNLFIDQSVARKNILLVRGLLLNGIILLCLKKRWNVQYGFHPRRDPIAVPFEAKGVPSEQAEFGHPDVSIIFTCLAFYYSGLTIPQLGESLQHVLKMDDPAAEYDRWTYGCSTLPENLTHWNVINIDDKGQLEELWRHLRVNRNVLDHYMNHFVFPRHAKQFGVKLQASGWDLPLFTKLEPGEITDAKTTGFSGTNDNKMMLPLNIRQDDLPSLSQTNAEVLTYLLQPRNRQYELAAWQGKRLTEEGLLTKLEQSRIRVLIDSGAHILEMDNETLVTKWLAIDYPAKAAVYFGDDNRAWVKYRGGKNSVPLLATPFAENLDECLVYFDEAHTRGIDLKLPQFARGAVTLALGQTKDHTVQAAMRLRQLGTTQSICFFAPPEVNQSILDVYKKLFGDVGRYAQVDSSHVVAWLLEQTCRVNEHFQHLYVAQGMDFCRRTNAQWTQSKFLTERGHREAFLSVIQQPELQTLEQLYGIPDTQPDTAAEVASPELKHFVAELTQQKLTARNSGNYHHSSVLEEVEQEREVEFQVEEVRQVQKPLHYEALVFPGLHKNISIFAKTGILGGDLGYEHGFEALSRTSIGQKYNIRSTESKLFVSSEFMRTVKLVKNTPRDNVLRSVEWILWSPSNETALIVITEEAELLIPILRQAIATRVYLITYAAPVTKNMTHFNGLTYYSLPSLPSAHKFPEWLGIELGIFAGRLYFDFQEKDPLSRYLRIQNWTYDDENSTTTSENPKFFTEKSIDFLLEWLTLRRKGQDIMHTPMGYICQGRPLNESHPFFLARSLDTDGATMANGTGRISDSEEDEEVETDYEYEYGEDLRSQGKCEIS